VQLIKPGIFWLDELSQILPMFSHISQYLEIWLKIGQLGLYELHVPPVYVKIGKTSLYFFLFYQYFTNP